MFTKQMVSFCYTASGFFGTHWRVPAWIRLHRVPEKQSEEPCSTVVSPVRLQVICTSVQVMPESIGVSPAFNFYNLWDKIALLFIMLWVRNISFLIICCCQSASNPESNPSTTPIASTPQLYFLTIGAWKSTCKSPLWKHFHCRLCSQEMHAKPTK